MSVSPESAFPIPEKTQKKINRRIRKVSNNVAYNLATSGDIESLSKRYELDLPMDDVGMIDQLVESNFEFNGWRKEPVRSGFIIGLTIRNKLIPSYLSWRKWQTEPFVPNLMATYNAYTKDVQSNGYDLSEYLQRSRLGWAGQRLWNTLSPELTQPYEHENRTRQEEVNASYAGALCLLASDGVTALHQQAMTRDMSKVERGLLTADWQGFIRLIRVVDEPETSSQWSPESHPPTDEI